MNAQNLKLASELINKSYIDTASDSINSREKLIKILLSHRILPIEGWDDLTIKHFLLCLSEMDTNNFPNKIGVGERESRIYSNIVAERHYYMGHGIGRSGDVNAVQPKAAGSSLLLKLTQYLAMDAIRLMGMQFIESLLVLPLATGMTLSVVLLTIQKEKPNAKYVIWPRIDQKTCLKCIVTANLIPVPIDGVLEKDEIHTNLDLIKKKIEELGKENILAIISTTSCFAPRVPDKIKDLAVICKESNLYHIINNAYGLQCSKIMFELNQASKFGKVDYVVQSTDKNFMVPVGGAIVFSQDKKLIKKVSELYPGRASSAPILDLFITLLSLGKDGLTKLLLERKENSKYLKIKLQAIAFKYQERVLETSNNTISFGVTLNKLKEGFDKKKETKEVSFFGAVLYSKRIMGSRCVVKSDPKEICGFKFSNYGSNIENYHSLPYFTVAAAIGMQRNEIDNFLIKLDENLKEFYQKYQDVIVIKELKEIKIEEEIIEETKN